ncbi:MAG: tetratricopeptide repeat protein [Verrucomicrobia bacterium]|nr:tetratricopeptide repeat protein [Verrucomicrobiota bacterium]
MATFEERYDEAMFAFSTGDYDGAIARLQAILAEDPAYFDARLSLGMAFYRKGDYAAAILEGHRAEALRPDEQLVHTNLSLFYLKSGDKQKAEHHGLQARIASWKTAGAAQPSPPPNPELELAKPKPSPPKLPDMPWKNKPKIGGGDAGRH